MTSNLEWLTAELALVETCNALRSLGHNLHVAAALTRAFRLGDLYGWDDCTREYPSRDYDNVCEPWSPNTEGRKP